MLATAFFVSSLTLAYISSQRTTGTESLLEDTLATESPLEPGMTGSDEAFGDEDFPELPEIGGVDPAADDGEMPALEPDQPLEDTGEQ